MLTEVLHSATTEVHVGKDIIYDRLSKIGGNKVLLIDPKVENLVQDIEITTLLLPSGERAKTWEVATDLLGSLCKMGVDRNTTLIAMGGGSTTDVAAFVASIYMRGIPLVLVPTTLLGCVDAAIGGKTAINTSFGKNHIGTIYHPKTIVVDVQTLQTLSENEWLNGFAEILKMGLVYNAGIWDFAKDYVWRPELIVQAIRAKMSVVAQDPLDLGLRRILNFGHTIGHGLEAVAEYQIPHGQAVAIGSVVESHLSMLLGYLPESTFQQIQDGYRHFPLKLPQGYTREKLMKAMSYDKKAESGRIRFVLIDQIGHAMPFEGAYVKEVSEEALAPALDWMQRSYS